MTRVQQCLHELTYENINYVMKWDAIIHIIHTDDIMFMIGSCIPPSNKLTHTGKLDYIPIYSWKPS